MTFPSGRCGWSSNARLAPTRPMRFTSVTLQRHLSVLTKSTHVESRFCGRGRQVKAAFCTPVNLCVRSVCSRSVVVGITLLYILSEPHTISSMERSRHSYGNDLCEAVQEVSGMPGVVEVPMPSSDTIIMIKDCLCISGIVE